MMLCPRCHGGPTQVFDSRPTAEYYQRRRRRCSSCGFRYTTFERPALDGLSPGAKSHEVQFDTELYELIAGMKPLTMEQRVVVLRVIGALTSEARLREFAKADRIPALSADGQIVMRDPFKIP